MTTYKSIVQLAATARELANDLRADIELAKTREEHIRISARANIADQLATDLENLGKAEN